MNPCSKIDSICDLSIFNVTVFVNIYQVLNSQAVAKRMGVQPSKISRALAALRQVFNDQLFIRKQYGFEPTSLAARLYPTMEQLLQVSDSLSDQLHPDVIERRRISIAVPATMQAGLTQYLSKVCRSRGEQLDIVTTGWNGKVVEDMESHHLDLGVFYALQGCPQLGSELVARNTSAYLVGCSEHPIWQHGSVNLSELFRYPIVVTEMTEFNDTEDPLEAVARKMAQDLKVAARVSSLTELTEMIANSSNLSVVCGAHAVNFLRSVNGIRVQRIPDAVRQEVLKLSCGDAEPGFHLVQRSGRAVPPWLVESLRQFTREAAEPRD
ncbi:DNA-binding transcriptional regulator, LysR family [Ferrimonas sediminum]|uniref:DNA-binding transcriptional regulator, LysR family n=1 Tax=Ferrimonas sediminum TaxID=718193 RepID=A0A1G8K154_9GAMM|nr:LysR family transcriptional regulator [Ferrimonas sediminum]SDI37148.1 DNA-binding transcriptional regulator, LysR family [Ferrimonas sediminum]